MSDNWLSTPDVHSLRKNETSVSCNCAGSSTGSQEDTHHFSQSQAALVKLPEATCLPEAQQVTQAVRGW